MMFAHYHRPLFHDAYIQFLNENRSYFEGNEITKVSIQLKDTMESLEISLTHNEKCRDLLSDTQKHHTLCRELLHSTEAQLEESKNKLRQTENELERIKNSF
jgi:hypothetical protein